MADLKYLEDKNGTVFLPITHFRAVRDSNGTNLETTLNTLVKQDYINGKYYSE